MSVINATDWDIANLKQKLGTSVPWVSGGTMNASGDVTVNKGKSMWFAADVPVGASAGQRETNAGSIQYNKHGGNDNRPQLEIIGGGKAGQQRLVKIWDDVEIPSNLSANLITQNSSNLVLGGAQAKNRWIIHTPDDDRKGLWIAPWNYAANDWDWSSSFQLNANDGKNVGGSFEGEDWLGRWGILRNGTGSFCMDGGGGAQGQHVYLHPCHGMKYQQWRFNGDELRHRASNRCLDVPGGNVNAGFVQTWDCVGGPNQQSAFDKGRIIHKASGRAVAVDGISGQQQDLRLETLDQFPDQFWGRI